MMKHLFFVIMCCAMNLHSQDTFSIVAADSTTREVGSAGASCLDLFAAGIDDPSFIGDLLPDSGAINTQAFYIKKNQENARARMRLGESPSQIINWLVKHDAGDNFTLRQYGIAGFDGDKTSSAGFTGNQTQAYKEHRTGNINGIHYAIQGNILRGKEIIDSMESRFRHSQGDLACRLMEALQGANLTGADSRCTSDGTSSLFAYVMVAQRTDTYGDPSFKSTVKTHDNSGIEPIDSLQVLFDQAHSCTSTSVKPETEKNFLLVYPNPSNQLLFVETGMEFFGNTYQVKNAEGKNMIEGRMIAPVTTIDIVSIPAGLYFLHVDNFSPYRFIKI